MVREFSAKDFNNGDLNEDNLLYLQKCPQTIEALIKERIQMGEDIKNGVNVDNSKYGVTISFNKVVSDIGKEDSKHKDLQEKEELVDNKKIDLSNDKSRPTTLSSLHRRNDNFDKEADSRAKVSTAKWQGIVDDSAKVINESVNQVKEFSKEISGVNDRAKIDAGAKSVKSGLDETNKGALKDLIKSLKESGVVASDGSGGYGHISQGRTQKNNER